MNVVPALLLALVLLCLCCFLGGGAITFSYRAQKLNGADALITGELLLTGLAVTAHLAAVFTGQSFSRCRVLFLGILGAAALFAAGLWLFYLIKVKVKIKGGKGEKPDSGPDSIEKLLTVIFLALATAQLIFLLWNAGVYTQGDMTVETVGSFLQTDGIYRVNPMTGQPYTAGIPSRLKILCLPTLYGIFCRSSGLTPDTVVTAAVPVWIFVSSYAAFSCVGRSLFPESRKKRICFLILVVILNQAGSSLYGMDGFNLLYCGYRGVTIRNLVFIPYLVSLCIRRSWKLAFLCIFAEVCIVWTLYGLGACALTAAGLFLAGRRTGDGGAC